MNAIKLLIAWTIVLVPLGWGLYHTIQKAAPIFYESAPPAAPAAPQGDQPAPSH